MPTPSRTSRVSVIVPAYNYAAYLPSAIHSILSQSWRQVDFEVVVVDDGSTDVTAVIARAMGPPVRVISQQNAGTAAALNRGIASTSADVLMFLDADDMWAPGKVQTQIDVLDRDPFVEAVFGRVDEFLSPDLGETDRRSVRSRAGMAGFVVGTLAIRREAFDRVGAFDTTSRFEFVDWYSRAKDAGLRECLLPDVCLQRRIHASNRTRVERSAHGDYARILKASLDRRRAVGAPRAGPAT